MSCFLFPGNNTPEKKYYNIKKIYNFNFVTDIEDIKEDQIIFPVILICHSSGIFDCLDFFVKFNLYDSKILCIDTCILNYDYYKENKENFTQNTINKYELYFSKNYKIKFNLILFREIFNITDETTNNHIKKI